MLITRAPAPGADATQGRECVTGHLTSDSSSIFMPSICRRSNKVPSCSAEENFSGREGRKGDISKESLDSVLEAEVQQRLSEGPRCTLGPAPTLGCCGAPSSPSGHLPEQRVQRSPSQTSAHQPPCCQPGKPGAGLRSPPTNPSPLLPHRGLTSPVWPPKFQDSPSHLHRWQAPGHREPGSAMQSTEAEVAKLTAAGQGASSLSNPNPVSSRLCTLAKRLNLFGLPFSHL